MREALPRQNLQPSRSAELTVPKTGSCSVRGSTSPARTGRPSAHEPEQSAAAPSRWLGPDIRRQLPFAADLATALAPSL